MYKYLIFIFLLCVSCASPKIAIYSVSPNDVAAIDLYLKKNQKFGIHFKDLEEVPEKTYKFSGKWFDKGKTIRLLFKLDKNDAPDLAALFDPALDETNSVKILDKKTVEFKKDAKRITIWGLSCIKSDLKIK